MGHQLVWFRRFCEKAGEFGAPDDANLLFPQLSPKGQLAAVTRGPEAESDIWTTDGARLSRFTFEPRRDVSAVWSPDGKNIIFSSNRRGQYDLYQKAANGEGAEKLLLASEDSKTPNSWSLDGRFLFYFDLKNNGDLVVLPLSGDRRPFAFLSTPAREMLGAFSPDCRWVAYASSESGRSEVYVRPFPGPGGQWQISTAGGQAARSRADVKELYFVAPDNKLIAVEVKAQGAFSAPARP